jgi:hypothetical protein
MSNRTWSPSLGAFLNAAAPAGALAEEEEEEGGWFGFGRTGDGGKQLISVSWGLGMAWVGMLLQKRFWNNLTRTAFPPFLSAVVAPLKRR